MAEHPIEVDWMEDLAERVAARRRELALVAEEQPPTPKSFASWVRRLSTVQHNARERWLANAGALEGYREQWRVAPITGGSSPSPRARREPGCAQAVAWNDVQLQLEAEPAAPDWLQWAHRRLIEGWISGCSPGPT